MNNVLPGEQKRGETFLDRKYFYYPITKLDPRSDPTLVVDTRTVSVLLKVINFFMIEEQYGMTTMQYQRHNKETISFTVTAFWRYFW